MAFLTCRDVWLVCLKPNSLEQISAWVFFGTGWFRRVDGCITFLTLAIQKAMKRQHQSEADHKFNARHMERSFDAFCTVKTDVSAFAQLKTARGNYFSVIHFKHNAQFAL